MLGHEQLGSTNSLGGVGKVFSAVAPAGHFLHQHVVPLRTKTAEVYVAAMPRGEVSRKHGKF